MNIQTADEFKEIGEALRNIFKNGVSRIIASIDENIFSLHRERQSD